MANICEKWRANKTINPRTGRKITTTGKVYKDLEIECKTKSPPSKESPLKKICEEFKKNPAVNPETKRTIQKGKGVYNKYMKLCEEFQTKRKSTPKQKTPSPQLGKLQKFVSNCYNDVDPITQEEFTEEQIPNIVKIGNGSKKYCFELFPLYRYLVSERLKLSEPIINPVYSRDIK